MTLKEEVENLKRQLREVVRDRFDTLDRAQMMVIQIGNDLEEAEKERDEARAEVERLREQIKAFAWETHDLRAANATMLADWHSQRRAAAERQRDACAKAAGEWIRSWQPMSGLEFAVQNTPLVTEVEP